MKENDTPLPDDVYRKPTYEELEATLPIIEQLIAEQADRLEQQQKRIEELEAELQRHSEEV